MSQDRAIDWVFTGLALALATLFLAGRASVESSQAPFGGLDFRTLEEPAMVYDASQRYTTIVRDIIGLEGKPEDTPPLIVGEIRRDAEQMPWVVEPSVALIAIATALEVDDVASAELRELRGRGGAPEVMAAWIPALEALGRLQAGQASEGFDGLVDQLRGAGASAWLIARLEARQRRAKGDDVGASAAIAKAQDHAVAYADAVMGFGVTNVGLLLLGLFTLLGAPLLLPALRRRGHPGLGLPVSPFRTARTQRVMAAWFAGHLLLAWLLATVVVGLGLGTPRWLALQSAAEALLHGAVAIALINRWARRDQDQRPLAECFNLSPRLVSGGLLGGVGWVLAGLGVAAFAAQAGSVLRDLLLGPPDAFQPSVQLLLADDSPMTLVAIGAGAILFAPVVEEIIFRGFFYRNLRQMLGRTQAVLLSGLIFGAVHLDPDNLLPLTGLGVALALIYEWTGALLVPIVVHAVWNALNLTGIYAIYHAA